MSPVRLSKFESIESLLAISNANARGSRFEGLLADLFRAAYFNVHENPKAARPRQTDLVARLGSDTYLIEAKCWTSKAVGTNEVDSLRSRLDRTPPNVIGVLASASGFTRPAVEAVESQRSRPIVLFGREDLDALLAGDLDLRSALASKVDDLTAHGRASGSPRRALSSTAGGDHERLVPSDLAIVMGGQVVPYIAWSSRFGETVFVPDLIDPDWTPTPGRGVALGMQLPVSDSAGLSEVLSILTEFGWAGVGSAWSVRQQDTSWHGFGSVCLQVALDQWRERYDALARVHHTEAVCWYAECEGGFYTLQAQVQSRGERLVWQAEITFRLQGLPMDITPFRELAQRLGARSPVFFRSVSGETLARNYIGAVDVALRLLALLVVTDEVGSRDGDDQWVRAIVVVNPFGERATAEAPEWWPDSLDDEAAMICDLQSWHPVSDGPRSYVLRSCEWVEDSYPFVFRAVADWLDDSYNSPPRAPRLAASQHE